MQRLQPGTLGRILFWEQGHFGETAGITVTVRTYDTSEEVDVYYAGGGIIGMLCNNTGSLSNFCVDDMDFFVFFTGKGGDKPANRTTSADSPPRTCRFPVCFPLYLRPVSFENQ